MPLGRELVNGDEDVLVEMRPHPSVVVPPFLLLAAAVAAAVEITLRFPSAPIGVAWVLVAMVGLPALWAAGRFVRWRSTRLVVTSRRVLYRRGVLRRAVVQLRLQRIAEVECTQGALEHLIGRGRLIFEVAAGDGPLVIDDVRRPRAVQRIVSRELDSRDHVAAPVPYATQGAQPWNAPQSWTDSDTPPRGMTRAARAVHGSVSDSLFQLDELRRRGVISEAEFSAKKAELLDRL